MQRSGRGCWDNPARADRTAGLRRGEAAGLRWIDVDLDEGVVMITQQRITFGHTTTVGPLKTRASRRTIALDRQTMRVLRAHRQRGWDALAQLRGAHLVH
jgi:integrase